MLDAVVGGAIDFGQAILDFLVPSAHAAELNLALNPELNNLFTAARGWVRRDPLSLDLDGDGIEAVGATSTILFDHDGDGVKSGTGWLKGDDGLLVLDKNGNGTIDNGTELFGVDYVKSDGSTAAHGFDALSDLDSNGDGVFDSQDARYADVRVWRDLNQDGISDAGELASLAEHGIASIDLGYATRTVNLGNGNRQSAEAAYTRTDGSTGLVANLDFADNPFYRQYADRLDTTTVADLPDMQGSGALRDLKEAATLSPGLAAQLGGLATYRTRAQLVAQLDGLIAQWAATGTMEGSVAQAAQQGIQLHYLPPGATVASLNNALAMRTRLKPYLDEIGRGKTICESRGWRDGGKVVREAANDGVWRRVA
jgi:hypothetical protein